MLLLISRSIATIPPKDRRKALERYEHDMMSVVDILDQQIQAANNVRVKQYYQTLKDKTEKRIDHLKVLSDN